jgi:hypothetical protein
MVKKNKLRCNSCGRIIPFDEEFVKENLLYQTSDWHQCLCSRCTANWKIRKEIAEAHPDFGKRVGYKMVVIDEI